MDYTAEYRRLHKKYQKKYRGLTVLRHVDKITNLVNSTGAKTILDYGCGKGHQYQIHKIHEQWNLDDLTLYDVGVPEFAAKPQGQFDGVICTDVMEHIEEEDVPDILADVIGYATKFVYFNISCRPAKSKRLMDGRNVHVTVKHPAWWTSKIMEASKGSEMIIVTDFEGHED